MLFLQEKDNMLFTSTMFARTLLLSIQQNVYCIHATFKGCRRKRVTVGRVTFLRNVPEGYQNVEHTLLIGTQLVSKRPPRTNFHEKMMFRVWEPGGFKNTRVYK